MLIFLTPLYEAIAGWLVRIAGTRGAAWLAAKAVAAGLTLARPDDVRAMKEWVYAMAEAWALELAGLHLDKTNPFSDASLCNAIGEKTGIALRTVKNKESMRADIEHWGLAKLEEKTGLHIKDIHNAAGVKKEVMRFASPIVTDATGIPLTDLSSTEKTKAEVTSYLQDRALILLSHDVARAQTIVRSVMESAGMTIESLVEQIVKKGGIDPVTGQPNVKIDAQMVIMGILSRAIIKAAGARQVVEEESNKKTRRREQMRTALRSFRKEHGSRMVYMRVR